MREVVAAIEPPLPPPLRGGQVPAWWGAQGPPHEWGGRARPRLGNNGFDDRHRAVGAPEGDLDAARELVEIDVEGLAVGYEVGDRLLGRLREQLHPDPLRLFGPGLGGLFARRLPDRRDLQVPVGPNLLELDDLPIDLVEREDPGRPRVDPTRV